MDSIDAKDVRPVVKIFNRHAVPSGHSWADRTLSDLQFILILSGSFEYITASGRRVVAPGEVLFIEPGTQHTFRHKNDGQPGEISGFHCELGSPGTYITRDYKLDPAPARVTKLPNPHPLRHLFFAGAEIWQGFSTRRLQLLEQLVRMIVVQLAEYWSAGAGGGEGGWRIHQMMELMRTRLPEPTTRHDLAKAFHLSPEHVNWVFQRELGQTPRW